MAVPSTNCEISTHESSCQGTFQTSPLNVKLYKYFTEDRFTKYTKLPSCKKNVELKAPTVISNFQMAKSNANPYKKMSSKLLLPMIMILVF